MGEALMKLLRYNEARAAYKEGLDLNPADPTLKKKLENLDALLEELQLNAQANKGPNPDADRFSVMVKWLKDGGSKVCRCLFPALSSSVVALCRRKGVYICVHERR